MIPLRLSVAALPLVEPLVVRLRHTADTDEFSAAGRDAILLSFENGIADYDASGIALQISTDDLAAIEGDILLVLPQGQSAHRLIRAGSNHNTLLVTERCDQLCIMCSQPPKKYHVDLFNSFFEAVLIAPRGCHIGISGGEPMLFKNQIFDFLLASSKFRPDIKFHVLTNGQHFSSEDSEVLEEIGTDRVLWGIPLYSENAVLHDMIVGKEGAHERLLRNLAFLIGVGVSIELRTVVMKSNEAYLPALAYFVTSRLPTLHVWALMQMERIGFGRMNWSKEFFDSSADFKSLARALDIALVRRLPTSLYNFPSCSVPSAYRSLCENSISDWKKKYLPACAGCSLRDTCSGFFEWTPADGGFSRIAAQ